MEMEVEVEVEVEVGRRGRGGRLGDNARVRPLVLRLAVVAEDLGQHAQQGVAAQREVREDLLGARIREHAPAGVSVGSMAQGRRHRGRGVIGGKGRGGRREGNQSVAGYEGL